ncbi:MAG: phosphatase 2C-like domain-containing protein [Monoraphidium minutum]|nr:MAG: phosphatase 2C-like domain-containing protein [Monoraphidium minutum]
MTVLSSGAPASPCGSPSMQDAVEAHFQRSLALQQLGDGDQVLAPLTAVLAAGAGAQAPAALMQQPSQLQQQQRGWRGPQQQQQQQGPPSAEALEKALQRRQLEDALRLPAAPRMRRRRGPGGGADGDASSSPASGDDDSCGSDGAEPPRPRRSGSGGSACASGGRGCGAAGAAPAAAATPRAPLPLPLQRPPLPPQLTPSGSGAFPEHGPLHTSLSGGVLHTSLSGGVLHTSLSGCVVGLGEPSFALARRSTCSSLGTCSDDEAAAPPPPPASHGAAGGAPEPRSVSFAATPGSGGSRRASMLSELARASRRTSNADSGGDAAAADEGPWWAAKWSFGTHQEQNRRRHMEDRLAAADVSALPAFAGYKRAGFFAVFDGHSGAEAAEYLQEHLLAHLSDLEPSEVSAAPGAALRAAVERAESEIIRSFSAAACNAGSTLLAALLLDDQLHVANVGDSRAVLSRGTDAIQITTDHKPHDELEAARIAREHGLAPSPAGDGGRRLSDAGRASSRASGRASAASGRMSVDSAVDDGCTSAAPLLEGADGSFVTATSSVVSSDGYLYGELAVARAIGSQHLKRDPTKRAFTHVPDIHSIQLAREDDMLLLATDGLWDAVDNFEAVTSARRTLAREKDAGACARALAERAVRQESADNITVVVVCLHDRGISLPKTNSMLFRRLGLSTGGGGGGADGSRPATPGTTPGGSACATPAPAASPTGPGPRCDTPPA